MAQPDVSIVISCFNKEKYLADTLESIIVQSIELFEVLVVDDASTDHSALIAREFQQKDKRITIIQQKTNRGANFCRNVGLYNSKAEWIVFLDADDILAADCLEQRLNQVKEKKENNFFVFPMGVFNNSVGDCTGTWQPRARHPLKDFLAHRLPWAIIQPMWRTSFLRQINGFDPSFERLQDVELHTRALLQPGVKFEVFPGKPDCFFRIDDARKNFNTTEFLGRWVRSAVKYYNKFYPLVPRGMRKYLFGTVYKTHSQLAYHFKKGEISRPELKSLEKELMTVLDQRDVPAFKRTLFAFAGYYKTRLPRVPGINRLLEALLIHL